MTFMFTHIVPFGCPDFLEQLHTHTHTLTKWGERVSIGELQFGKTVSLPAHQTETNSRWAIGTHPKLLSSVLDSLFW